MSENKTPDKEDLLHRLFVAMGCDDLEMAVLQAELDAREALKAAEAIKQCAGLPENVWPSPHERRFFVALKEYLSARGENPIARAMTEALTTDEENAKMCAELERDELWPQAGTFHCACVFNRAEDFGEAKLIRPCAYHAKHVAHDWQPDGGKVTWESHPGGEAPHVHTTCSKCGARAWFLEFHWELLSKGCSDAKSSYVGEKK